MMLNVILITLYVVFAVGGSTLIKYGGIAKDAALFTVPIANVSLSPISFLGILFYGASFVLYILLLNRLELSFVSPVTVGIVYVLLMITAVLVFGEQMTVIKMLGCGLILAGVLLVLTGK